MHAFAAPLELIGINPFVRVPDEILAAVFAQAGRSKGPIRVCGEVNGRPYQQTLVRYAGLWRFYVNLAMMADSPRRIGEVVNVCIAFNQDPAPVLACPALDRALAETPAAQLVFDRLLPSQRLEIVRYLARLKSAASLTLNVARAVGFLLGKNRFVGRDRP